MFGASTEKARQRGCGRASVQLTNASLRTYGRRNEEIYAQIAAELRDRLVAAPELSERQVRRTIYG